MPATPTVVPQTPATVQLSPHRLHELAVAARAHRIAVANANARAAAGRLAGSVRARLLAAARSYIGVPYKYGGSSRSGTDCSGLVDAVYKQALGMKLPRTAADLATHGRRTTRPAIGDVLVYGTTHAAIVAAVKGARVTNTIVASHAGTVVHFQVPYAAYAVRAYVERAA